MEKMNRTVRDHPVRLTAKIKLGKFDGRTAPIFCYMIRLLLEEKLSPKVTDEVQR